MEKSLEEFFKELREKGMEDKEIVKKVFEIDLNADIGEIERITGLKRLDIGRIKGQVSLALKRLKKKAGEETEEAPLEESESRQLVAQFGREGLNKIKKHMLNLILQKAPGVSSKTREYILFKWDVNKRAQDDPNELFNILHREGGLKTEVAGGIVRDVFSVETQYADLLQQRGEQPIFIGSTVPPGQTQPPYYGFPAQPFQPTWPTPQAGPFFSTYGVQGTPQAGYPPQISGYYTPQDVQKMREDWSKDQEIKNLRKDVQDLREDLPKMIKESLPSAQPSEDFEEVSEYIDGKGNIVHPDAAVSVRITRKPLKKGVTADNELLKEIKGLREDAKKSELHEIRDEIKGLKEKKPATEETPELRGLREDLRGLKEQYSALEKQMTEQEKHALQSQISGLQTQISGLQSSLSARGVTTPEGVLATAITEAGKREPVKIVIEGLERMSGVPGARPAPPPSAGTPAAPEKRGGVLKVLGEQGLVTTIRERIRGQ